MSWSKTVPQGPKGERGEQGLPGRDGQGSGTVNKVNGIEPDETGDVTLQLPDISELMTNQEFQEHETKIASATVLGHVKVGENLSIGADGKLNASSGTVPDASTTIKGIVKLNDTLISPSTTEAATANAVKHLNDIKVDKLQEGWIAAVLAGAWINTGGDYESLRYYKDTLGVCHVSGIVSNPSSNLGIITTLPVGYRPDKNLMFFSSTDKFFINSNGTVVMGGGTNDTTSKAIQQSFRTV